MYDTIIIGSGIAGLTAGIYMRRGNAKTLILEKNTFGGQIVEAKEIENYPGEANISGYDLMKKIYDQAISLGCEIKYEEVLSIEGNETVVTKDNVYKAKTIIIANGLTKRKLGLYSEAELTGLGISYCATCDGAFYKDKVVAIVGGGNKAIEEALYLANIVKTLHIIHRNDTFKCDNILIEKLKKYDNIIYHMNNNITSLNGEDKLSSIVLDDDEKIELDGLFVSIGNNPDNLRFSNILNLDEYGYIISDDCLTNVSNIFVAGDTRTKKFRQLVTASSDGAIAASLALKYLQK